MDYTSGLLLLILITIVVFVSVIGPSFWILSVSKEGFQTEPKTEITETEIKNTADMLGLKFAESKGNQIETQLKLTAESSKDGELSKYPIPWEKFEKKTMETDKTQDRQIEDIRRVLSTTINTLVEDDVLPAGTSNNCDALPIVNSTTGQVDPADGCRPPGWLRMMNARNERRL